MVLVDTSAWVVTGETIAGLASYVRSAEIATCLPVMQELLQGTDTEDDFRYTRAMLLRTRVLDAPLPLERYVEAARLYLRCRDAGFTIRKTADCLIAACALAHDAEVLHNDRDFQFIAEVTGLRARRV